MGSAAVSISTAPIDSTCKACGALGRKLFENANQHGALAVITSFRCPACGLVFVGDRPSHKQLGEAYGSIDCERYYREIRDTNAAKMRRCADDLLTLPGLSKRSAFIDLGCGNGEFPLLMRELGFSNLGGHEIPGADLSLLREAGIVVWQDYDYETVPEGAFDCVTMLDVAEHVPDPAHLFAACQRLLRPGGWLYFHTPGVSRLDRLMHRLGPVGRKWQRGRTSIFHLQNYSRRSLELLLSDFDELSIRQVNELSWPLSRYVRVYLRPPEVLAPVATAAAWPFLATRLNANKMIVAARKR